IDNRVRNVTMFADWCDASTVADVKPVDVTRWLAARAETGDAPETVLTRFRHLRAFYRWCEREEIVEKSPLATLREPTVETQPVHALTDDELRALFATCKGTTFADRRDFAMLAFLADTGVRVGELVALEVEDLDFKTSTAPVVGKFGRRRVVAFGPKAGKAVLAYLRARAGHKDAGEARLWIGQRRPPHQAAGLKIGERAPSNGAAVRKLVTRRGAAAGIKDLPPPALRHTSPPRFRSKGAHPDARGQRGGGRPPAMLARYGASAAAERAIEAHRRVDPL